MFDKQRRKNKKEREPDKVILASKYPLGRIRAIFDAIMNRSMQISFNSPIDIGTLSSMSGISLEEIQDVMPYLVEMSVYAPIENNMYIKSDHNFHN